MIERISIHAELNDIAAQFKTSTILSEHKEKYNVTPTKDITIVMNDRHNERIIREARWGLFPFWAKDAVNTTKQDIRNKNFLQQLVKRNRCVVPCTGFYGSKPIEQEKDPRAMHIVIPGKPLFGIAAIYDCFRNAVGKETHMFTFLTTETVGHFSSWLPSLPIVLDEDGVEAWLSPADRNFDLLQSHLPHLSSQAVRAYPVTNAVHNDKYEAPDCIMELNLDFAYLQK